MRSCTKSKAGPMTTEQKAEAFDKSVALLEEWREREQKRADDIVKALDVLGVYVNSGNYDVVKAELNDCETNAQTITIMLVSIGVEEYTDDDLPF